MKLCRSAHSWRINFPDSDGVTEYDFGAMKNALTPSVKDSEDGRKMHCCLIT
jgi:hypothetical protein